MITTILRAENWPVTRANLYRQLKSLDRTVDWQISIQKFTPEKWRTISQNAYLHAIIVLIEEHRVASGLPAMGKPILYLYLKGIHFGIKVTKTDIGEIQEIRSTSNLGVKPFAEFVEFIRRFAYDEYGEFYVMTPDEWRQWQHEKNKS